MSDLAELFSSIFTVIDGSIGLEGPVACFGAPAESNMIISSGDIVAADAVGTKVMGQDPNNVDHITEAARRGLGKLDQIDVRGDAVEKVQRRFNMDPELPLQIIERMKALGVAREDDLLALYPSDQDLVRRYLRAFVMYGPLVREDNDRYRFENKLLPDFICKRCTQTYRPFCARWKQL